MNNKINNNSSSNDIPHKSSLSSLKAKAQQLRDELSDTGNSSSADSQSSLTTTSKKKSPLSNNNNAFGNLASIADQAKILSLQNDLKRRQESYVRRERAYIMRINDLEKEIKTIKSNKLKWAENDEKMQRIRNLHGQILENVEIVQDRTAKILQEQERDLIRAFRARLFDVQAELDNEKNKKDDGASAWIERSRKLEEEVEWMKEIADKLDHLNQTLNTENSRLKSQFKSQEQDREFLIKQLVAVKKENSRLKQDLTKMESNKKHGLLSGDITTSSSGGFFPSSNNRTPSMNRSASAMAIGSKNSMGNILNTELTGLNTNGLDVEHRYKEIIKRLRRLLDSERRNIKEARINLMDELEKRSEVEKFLRICIEDVRTEINNEKMKLLKEQNNRINELKNNLDNNNNDNIDQPLVNHIRVEDFTKEDREKVLEVLLSKERVLVLLYGKTFHPTNPAKENTNEIEINTNRSKYRPRSMSSAKTPSNTSLPLLSPHSNSNTPHHDKSKRTIHSSNIYSPKKFKY